MLTEVPGKLRQSGPAQTEWHRVEGVDPSHSPGSPIRRPETGRDHERQGAAIEAALARQVTEDGEQRPGYVT